jgi:hypothetical protein
MTTEVEVGARVVTADGHELGKVKSVEPDAFLIDAPHQFDYWLERTIVRSANSSLVELIVAGDEIAAYKMDRPHDHNEFQAGASSSYEPATKRGDVLGHGPRP